MAKNCKCFLESLFLLLGTVACGSKICMNGGKCENGKCTCQEGYSGPECGEILMTLL